MNLPETIQIGATTYVIIERDEAWRVYAECDGQVRFNDLEIDIVKTRPATEVLNTLIHELCHVIWREYHLPQRPKEERCVTVMGFGWSALYVQNPGLAALLGELSDEDYEDTD